VSHHPVEPQMWERLAAEPEFRALIARRRRFVIPATIFFIAYYLALPISIGVAPQFMSRSLGPLSIAYWFALSQFVMTWLLMAAYVLRARSFDLEAARLRHRETHEVKG
jgi:uncharacterized membrane protein (DUF485 family)